MKMRVTFFLVVIGLLHFPSLSQAVALPNEPILQDGANKSPKLLSTQNGFNRPFSTKVDEAALLRKTMRIQAMIQRSWIASMVVPGLGQVYNKDYWKVPCLYLGVALVGSRIYSEHQAMHKHKRILLITDGIDQPNEAFTKKRIQECERTRNLFIMIASAWYLLNIFDAYARGHDKTVNFKDDIGTKSSLKSTDVLQPAAATSIAKSSFPQ